MATIVLGAVGASFGAGFGGVLGLGGAVLGRAVGATLGRVVDQRLLGAGSEAVEAGRVDRFRVTGASEGTAVGRVWGRMRLGGQVIWASSFREHASSSGGSGKGSGPKVTQYSYSVSLAVALCEGEIAGIGRIWADGVEIGRESVTMRVYPGSEDQLPDPAMEAAEGAGQVPAYRGIAYVVFEDLMLEPYGNRVPQFSIEVMRPAQGVDAALGGMAGHVRAVAMIPGTGEYALATTPVRFDDGLGGSVMRNVNSPAGVTDFAASLDQLGRELPQVGSVSLVVSWFGNDLRCGACRVEPKVEQKEEDGEGMPWRVAGADRAGAGEVARLEGRPVYGGTPCDASVVEAIRALNAAGQKVMFYPFILMEQMVGNTLPDPWTGGVGQPPLPWRGRITTSRAPGVAGSPDGTAAAAAEVAAFFGTAAVGDFAITGREVRYSGPQVWDYRRFILHYAHLCKAAGGVDAFCIGSEMRGLTAIRGAGNSFPAVAALRVLAAEVKAILRDTRVSYAADWSEYSGHTDPQGNRWFHLDALWSDPAIDFIGIDNYLPLSDWRDGSGHLDASWGSIHDLAYLRANIEGGEYYDWYYASAADRAAQIRTPITDGLGEPWIWRAKDIRSWWEQPHYNRVGGLRQTAATSWVPRSKPIWFTEIGCAAVDKGTNEPNKFLDPKSSESSLPAFSTGARDDLIQLQYLRATYGYWGEAARNPVSPVYGGPMIDMARAHVWCWDSRPFPAFPNAQEVWSDGANHPRGHWITGRTASQPLEAVIAELCQAAGVAEHDVSGVRGLVRGFSIAEVGTARAALQSLMLAHGVEAAERDGVLRFSMRGAGPAAVIEPGALVASGEGALRKARAAEAEIAGRMRLGYVEAEGDYETRSTEAAMPDDEGAGLSSSELSMALTATEARGMVERWLTEARVARESVQFTLPPSRGELGAGDVVQIAGEPGLYRIDRVDAAEARGVEAVRVEPAAYRPAVGPDEPVAPRPFRAPAPVLALFLDLPLMSGAEVEHAPHLAVTATPWPGSVAVHSAPEDAGYELNRVVTRGATLGRTLTPMAWAPAGVWDRGPALQVKMRGGSLASADAARVLNGANAAAIGDGTPEGWEVFQFREAVLVAPDTWEIRLRLRGQAGTDATMPAVWPAGSWFVALNGVPEQIDLAASARGLSRHYRIGPASEPYDHASYRHVEAAFRGVGLRPYAPAHLRMRRAGGDPVLSWIRRTRIDGDAWEGREVPLSEASERYLLRVIQGGATRREVELAAPEWAYTAALRAADGVAGTVTIAVAQLSERFGAGPFTEMDIDV